MDLLPAHPALSYSRPPLGQAYHVSPPGLHPKYDYPDFIGGIMLINTADFERVNGMSNRYWGWGLEDDEFRARLVQSNVTIGRPDVSAIDTGRHRTFKHVHAAAARPRDYRKCYNQRDATKRRDRETGAADVAYMVRKTVSLAVEGQAVTVLNVELQCDKEKTPWCDCNGAPATEAPQQPVDPKDNIMPWLPRKRQKRKK